MMLSRFVALSVSLTQKVSLFQMHNGGTNVRLNVHLGMSGLGGSRMIVAGEAKEWSAEKTITFDVCPARPHADSLLPC